MGSGAGPKVLALLTSRSSRPVSVTARAKAGDGWVRDVAGYAAGSGLAGRGSEAGGVAAVDDDVPAAGDESRGEGAAEAG